MYYVLSERASPHSTLYVMAGIFFLIDDKFRRGLCVCVREGERVSVCVFMCVCARERVCACVC